MMTEEEKRIARNEASRRCRMKKLAAMGKQLPAANKAEIKRAKKPDTCGRTPSGKDPTAATQKLIDKLVRKYAKPVGSVKCLMKEAAAVLSDVYKAGDEKFIAKTEKTLLRELCLAVDPVIESEGRPKMAVSLEGVYKTFGIPKKKDAVETHTPSAAEPVQPEPDTDTEDQIEIAVDPDVAEKLADNPDIAPDVTSDEQSDDEIQDEDFRDDDECDEDYEDDEDETDETDEADLTDEEREERRYREEEALDEDYATGRWDAMAELGAQGMGEED